jgi:hypothetical protein
MIMNIVKVNKVGRHLYLFQFFSKYGRLTPVGDEGMEAGRGRGLVDAVWEH